MDGFEVVRWPTEEVPLHEVPELLRHLICSVVVDDTLDEVVTTDDSLDCTPAVNLVTQEGTDRLHRKLDGFGWVGHGTDFLQVLTFDIADGGLGVKDSRFSISEVGHDDLPSLLDVLVLLFECRLYLDGRCLLLLRFLLVRNHLLELVVRF